MGQAQRPGDYWGFSQQPYDSYFPNSGGDDRSQGAMGGVPNMPNPTLDYGFTEGFTPPPPSPFMARMGTFNPYAEQKAAQAGSNQADLENLDMSDPDAMTGLQRLIASGAIAPQRANSMMSVARFSKPKINEQSTAFLSGVSQLNPNDDKYWDKRNDLIQKFPEGMSNPYALRALDKSDSHFLQQQKYNNKPALGRSDVNGLQTLYRNFVEPTTDSQKSEAFAKQFKANPTGMSGPVPRTDEDWGLSHHLARGPMADKFIGRVNQLLDKGIDPPEWIMKGYDEARAYQVRSPLGNQPQPAGQPAAAAPAQSTEGGQSGYSSVTFPNGKTMFGTTEQISAVKTKFGLK